MSSRVLVVDDDPDARELLVAWLGSRGHQVEIAATADEARARLQTGDIDTVLADVRLQGTNGIDLCREIAERRPDVPVLIITGYGSMDVAVAAIRAGAYDFITKPIAIEAVALAVDRAVRHRQLTCEVRRLREEATRDRSGPLKGDSPPMRYLLDLVERVADSDATVLITGESGTGKELVARTIHDRSPRREGPFVPVNCAAVSATLLESELFGHVKGAFTDARKDRAGLFAQASGGTVLLDEIGDMPAEMQVKLLRALQERKAKPVGDDHERPFDVRIVAATNKDLEAEVEDGRFRRDLYYRLNVVHVEVPALRSRVADILTLAHAFLARCAERSGKPMTGISRPAAQKLIEYDWPGNVRELENCVERGVALGQMSELGIDDLPERIRDHRATRLIIESNDPDEMLTLEEVERRYLQRVLGACGGNKSHAARVLGIDRRSLYRRIEALAPEAKPA